MNKLSFVFIGIFYCALFFSIAHEAYACTAGTPCVEAVLQAPTGEEKTFGSKSCAADFMKQVQARAWIEAQREIAYNPSFMDTPLSVLSLSCFKEISSAAKTGEFGNEVLSDGVTNLVETPLDGFTDYACDAMKTIWKNAQCRNYEGEFMSFQALVEGGTDPRDCDLGITQAHLDRAGNINNDTEFDAVDTFLKDNLVYESSCGEPIPTGLTASIRVDTENESIWAFIPYMGSTSEGNDTRIETFEEAVCATPGCYYHYDPESGEGECKQPE